MRARQRHFAAPADVHSSALVLDKRAIRVAIQPALAGFSRRDHRMAAAPRMFARVSVGRRIAAPRDAAHLASPQMDPRRSHLHALVTLTDGGLCDGGDRSDMCARRRLGAHDHIMASSRSCRAGFATTAGPDRGPPAARSWSGARAGQRAHISRKGASPRVSGQAPRASRSALRRDP